MQNSEKGMYPQEDGPTGNFYQIKISDYLEKLVFCAQTKAGHQFYYINRIDITWFKSVSQRKDLTNSIDFENAIIQCGLYTTVAAGYHTEKPTKLDRYSFFVKQDTRVLFVLMVITCIISIFTYSIRRFITFKRC